MANPWRDLTLRGVRMRWTILRKFMNAKNARSSVPERAHQLFESVVDLDAINDAIFSFRPVLHVNGSADLDARADIFIRERLPALRDVDDLFSVSIGHRPACLLHDERLSGHVFGNRAVA